MSATRPRIGLALGSGSARGWSHIGVIRALEAAGIQPDVVCGTSIGALVGAAYAAGELDRLEPWVCRLTPQSLVGLLDVRFAGGLIEGSRLVDFFRARFADPGIAGLARAFGCVATELQTGREVWLREGPVIDAVRASIALPGLFTPAQQGGRLLVDGGLVNPVPVSLCRAMGADIVIAVDLNWTLMSRRNRVALANGAATPVAVPDREPTGMQSGVQGGTPGDSKRVGPSTGWTTAGLLDGLMARLRPAPWREGGAHGELPSLLDVLSTSLNIMQVRLTHSRLAGEPAEVVIRPRLADIAAMDYHRAAEAIAAGRRATEQALPFVQELLQ